MPKLRVEAEAEQDARPYIAMVTHLYGIDYLPQIAELFYEGIQTGNTLITSRLPGPAEINWRRVASIEEKSAYIDAFNLSIRNTLLDICRATLGKG